MLDRKQIALLLDLCRGLQCALEAFGEFDSAAQETSRDLARI